MSARKSPDPTIDPHRECYFGDPRFASFSYPSSFAPNTHCPGLLMVEAGIAAETRGALAALGHDVDAWPLRTRNAGSLCAIRMHAEPGFLHAGADSRRAGYAMGR